LSEKEEKETDASRALLATGFPRGSSPFFSELPCVRQSIFHHFLFSLLSSDIFIASKIVSAAVVLLAPSALHIRRHALLNAP